MSRISEARIALLRRQRMADLTAVCTRYDAAADWAVAETFVCHHNEASPQTTGLVNFEGSAAGYGVNVLVPHDQSLNPSDRLSVDGITLEVQRVAVVGSLDLVKHVFCVKR